MTKKLLHFYNLLICFSLFACVNKHNQTDLSYSLNLENAASTPIMQINWDHYSNGHTLIALETKPECMLKEIRQLEETDQYFFILSEGEVFCFDHNGKYIRHIGAKGQGPAEYISAKRIATDNPNRLLYVMDYFGRKMIRYTFDGEFVNSFRLPEDYSIMQFHLMDSLLYLSSVNNSIRPDLLQLNPYTQNLDTISFREREMLKGEAYMGDTHLFYGNNGIRLYHYFNDTVYTLKGKTITPSYQIKTGELTYRFDELMVSEGHIISSNRISIERIIELPFSALIVYTITKPNRKENPSSLALIDFSSATSIQSVEMVSSASRWASINPQNPLFYSKESNSLITVVEPFELITYNLLAGLKEDDNPILIRHNLIPE